LDGKVAKLTLSIRDVHLDNIKMCSVDDLPVAGRAEGRIVNVSWNISNVNVFQTVFPCNFVSGFEG
jgi:hypothetical protein